jgi:RNA polymerase sigma-70 factor (ECF subfamily)
LLASERERLVRLCARLTGDLDAAEELAQETQLLAWRREHSLREPDRRWQWLAGIARNLCLHWTRRRGREQRRRAFPSIGGSGHTVASGGSAEEDSLAQLPDDFDLEVELERSELASLLDRAMALLPPNTRRVLVERYLEESPPRHTALRLGVTEGAVAMRLARGRLALRRIIATTLREEAAAYGLVDPEREAWQSTRIWCPVCGKRRLVGRFTTDGRLWLDCIDCPDALGGRGLARSQVVSGGTAALFAGVKGFKPALNRFHVQRHALFGRGTAGPPLRCARCGDTTPLRVETDCLSQHHLLRAVCVGCCNGNGCMATGALTLALPEGRAFWRAHPRLRLVPEVEVQAVGQPAIVTRVQSVTDSAELAVVFARDTLEVLGIHGASTRS